MTFQERLEICSRFDEGTEITDAIQLLVNTANILRGLNEKYKANIVLSLAEQCCDDYVKWLFNYGSSKDMEDFPNDVFKHFNGCDKPNE